MTWLEIVGVITLSLIGGGLLGFILAGAARGIRADRRIDEIDWQVREVNARVDLAREDIQRLEASNWSAHAAIDRLEAHHAEEEKA